MEEIEVPLCPHASKEHPEPWQEDNVPPLEGGLLLLANMHPKEEHPEGGEVRDQHEDHPIHADLATAAEFAAEDRHQHVELKFDRDRPEASIEDADTETRA